MQKTSGVRKFEKIQHPLQLGRHRCPKRKIFQSQIESRKYDQILLHAFHETLLNTYQTKVEKRPLMLCFVFHIAGLQFQKIWELRLVAPCNVTPVCRSGLVDLIVFGFRFLKMHCCLLRWLRYRAVQAFVSWPNLLHRKQGFTLKGQFWALWLRERHR